MVCYICLNMYVQQEQQQQQQQQQYQEIPCASPRVLERAGLENKEPWAIGFSRICFLLILSY